ncbi:MAG TPA: site-specific integrase [Pseudolabrys sp.]|nr:site-specific integrase [Pseudolabrys sp.]
MPKLRITERALAALKPAARAYIVYDTRDIGFGVRVMPSGLRSYVVEYRPYPGGRSVRKRRFKFAAVGDLPLDAARKRAAKLLIEAREPGGDPLEKLRSARALETVADLIADFLDDVTARRKKRTAMLYAYVLNNFVKPEFGARKVDGLNRPDLARLHRSIRDGKKALVNGRERAVGGLYTANRMLAAVGAMYSYAARQHIVPDGFNPARRIPKFRETARERFLTGDELDRLGAALREAETTGLPWQVDETKPTAKHAPAAVRRFHRFAPHATAAIRLLLFTGCRLREILNLRWGEVDLERGLLFLPDSKTGRKAVVLNAPAMSVLAELPRIGAYVIAGDKAGTADEKPRADLGRPWAAVCRRAGLSGVRLHDLRHTHASFGAAGGFGLPIIGKLLGHKNEATTARYAHLDLDPVRRASEWIGSRLAAAMGDVPKESKAAEVIPLRQTGG